MGILLGVIEYRRPSQPVTADVIKPLLTTAGKDTIRLAWENLNPDKDNYVSRFSLASWINVFFHMTSDAEADDCVRFLESIGLIYIKEERSYRDIVKPKF